MTNVNWRRTKLTRDLFLCDLCGKEATAIHFVTDGRYPHVRDGAQVDAVFACADHDAGGWWTELDRWMDPKGESQDHVGAKVWGQSALEAYEGRVNQILNQAAVADRKS
jgi:hypothetical protein